MEIDLPHNWQPRSDQMPLWRYLHGGGKRAVVCAHRRWGKDDVALHWAACAAHEQIGNYWHMLPQLTQARKVIWEAVNPHTGQRRIDEAFPLELRDATRDDEMLIRFKIGSTWQCIGSDNYNTLVGTPPRGLVFSEWALADPLAWAYFRPILRENSGWAIFISTPRGRNHLATMYEAAKDDPDWFATQITAEDSPVFTAEDLAKEKAEYIREFGPDDGESRFNQEYLCDFSAALVGAFYGRLMNEAEKDGRIGIVPRDGKAPVYTAWDIGVTDSTAIWFFQQVGLQIRVIDYYESSGQGVDHYAGVLKSKGYSYGEHLLPHDANQERFERKGTTTVSRMLAEADVPNRVLPLADVDGGIKAARQILPRCWFDRKKCERGIEALRQYRREWDDKLKTFKPHPLHDWTSHAADAFRYLARGIGAGTGDRMFKADPTTGKMPPINYPKVGVR